jgi:D-alanyl-D-alanine carboxypeptidase/D-alanyl-D-alanine-endopeptidase (penicillin-binding protein 4)
MAAVGWRRYCACFVIVGLLGWAGNADAAALKGSRKLEKMLAPLIGTADAVMVTAPDGRILAAIHNHRLLVPASTLKLITALAALHYLGETYRFPTDFYTSQDGDLIVKGYGDPLLISEQLDVIARHLAGQVQRVDDLVLDDSYFSYPIVVPGRNHSVEPYDAPNGALCVNFNTVSFEHRNGRWMSAEPQTPLLPSTIAKIKASGLTAGRITLAADRNESLRYAGELLNYFLGQAGIATSGTITFGRVEPQKDTLLWRYYSNKQLTDVIAELLEYSNNFIANQLLLAMGAREYRPPADLARGVRALRRYYGSVLGLKNGFLAEGSGISRRNHVSAQIMMFILKKFAPYHRLMRHQGRQFYKTGTLNGIHTRVGYLSAHGGGLYRFVVMVNTPGKTTDRIMRVIERECK